MPIANKNILITISKMALAVSFLYVTSLLLRLNLTFRIALKAFIALTVVDIEIIASANANAGYIKRYIIAPITPYFSMKLKEKIEQNYKLCSRYCIHVFGITLSPVTFSTQNLLISELLRTL